MHPGIHAAERPDAPAIVMAGSGEIVTYAALDAASNRLAHLFRQRGLSVGDHIAVFLDNNPRYLEVVWAALRSGLYVTPINWHLGPAEAGYIIEDCGAAALVTTVRLADVLDRAAAIVAKVPNRLVLDGELAGFEDYSTAVADQPEHPLADETTGAIMFYSSGTTGRPKGIMAPLTGAPLDAPAGLDLLLRGLYGFTDESIYLCPAPLYHAAPLGFSIAAQRIGGTVVVMESFDALRALQVIGTHRISHAQFVPTHFVRMLKLAPEERQSADVSSLRAVIHAAAPCPVEVKQQMLEWWGHIIYEYYAASEGNGFCAIGPEEWLSHPGSVGRSLLGPVHITNADGEEARANEAGQIWFESPTRFEYHNDPEKTAATFNDKGWSTLGDIGYLDDEGYVYLTDRVSHMIISGGVNIYPREIEDVIVLHPAVADVAVIGVPDDEMGEAVKAVVQLADPSAASPDLEIELMALCRSHLAGFKCPRSVDFVETLPRLPTGKLLKRVLRDQYGALA